MQMWYKVSYSSLITVNLQTPGYLETKCVVTFYSDLYVPPV